MTEQHQLLTSDQQEATKQRIIHDAGLLVGGMVYVYEEFLRSHLALMPYDLLHFSLRPFEPMRLAVGIGLVILVVLAAGVAFAVAFVPGCIATGIVATASSPTITDHAARVLRVTISCRGVHPLQAGSSGAPGARSALLTLIADTTQPAVVRASAIDRLGH